MPVVPDRTQDLLEFAAQHAPIWSERATELGLTAAQAAAFATASDTAKGKYDGAVSAEMARKAATAASNDAVRLLRRAAGDTIALIKAKAENSADPLTVYTLAQIPAPAAPTPLPPPGTPYKFSATLTETGGITLTFKCDNPAGAQGTIYEVRRRSTPTGTFDFIGASGVKKFADDTLPRGSSQVTYQVTAVRSTSRGASASFNVNFGVSGGVPFARVEDAGAGASEAVMLKRAA